MFSWWERQCFSSTGSLPCMHLEFCIQTATLNKHASSEAHQSKAGVYRLHVASAICIHNPEHMALYSTQFHEHIFFFHRASAALTVCVVIQLRYFPPYPVCGQQAYFPHSPVNIITEFPHGLTLKSESFKKSMHVSS